MPDGYDNYVRFDTNGFCYAFMDTLCISGLGYITFCLILSHNIMRPPYLCKFMAGFRGSSMNSSHPAEMNLIQVKLSFRKRRTFLSCLWGESGCQWGLE